MWKSQLQWFGLRHFRMRLLKCTDGCFACSVCAVSGYLASYWNHVFMPEKCRDPSFDDPVTYNTMIRSAGSWTSLGTVLQMIMQAYSWRHLVVMSDQNGSVSICPYGATSIINQLTTTDAVTSNYSVYFTAMDDNPSDSTVDYYLDIVHQRTRGKWIFPTVDHHRLTSFKNVLPDVERSGSRRVCHKGNSYELGA